MISITLETYSRESLFSFHQPSLLSSGKNFKYRIVMKLYFNTEGVNVYNVRPLRIWKPLKINNID